MTVKRRRTTLDEPGISNFITTMVVDFTPIFNDQILAQLMLDTLKICIQKYPVRIHGFVIMPNHLHILLTGKGQKETSQFIGKLKEYSAKKIISWCRQNQETNLLLLFRKAATNLEKDRTYRVWQRRFDNVAIVRHKDMLTKLNYIHNNPLQERWKLCQSSEDYPFSSAGYYIAEKEIEGLAIDGISE